MYDIIGDIHGQYAKLEALLTKLQYVNKDGLWIPPNGRKAVFLGDLIDRGPEQIKVLESVKAMCDSGYAHCIMGNHELNAIGYATPHPERPGNFVRANNARNLAQHKEFLEQVGEGSAAHGAWIEWFKTLPIYLDLGGIRVVHAWWHEPHIETLHRHDIKAGALSQQQVVQALCKHRLHEVYYALEGLCKGLEIRLPDGLSFTDRTGNVRVDARTKWWLPDAEFMHEIAIVEGVMPVELLDMPIPDTFNPLPINGAPVFIGHYWLQGRPGILSPKVACLDYSAAKRGPLVAYRWNGESELHDGGFVAAG